MLRVYKKEGTDALQRKVGEEQRKAIRTAPDCYAKEILFQKIFDSAWQGHADDYHQNYIHQNIVDRKRVMFFRLSLAHKIELGQDYECVNMKIGDSAVQL